MAFLESYSLIEQIGLVAALVMIILLLCVLVPLVTACRCILDTIVYVIKRCCGCCVWFVSDTDGNVIMGDPRDYEIVCPCVSPRG